MTENEEFEFRARLEAEQAAAAPKAPPESSAVKEYSGTESPGVFKQALGGAKHAWDRAAAGLQSAAGAVGLPTGESLQPLVKQGAEFVRQTGPASTIGQIGADVAMTAAPTYRVFKGLNALRPALAVSQPAEALTLAERARRAVFGVPATAGAADVATGYGYGALTANEGERLEGAVIGGIAGMVPNIVAPGVKAVASALGSGAAHTLGLTTGAGGQSIKQAFQGGPDFVANMRGNALASEVVDQARAGIQTMRQQMHDAYATAKGGWASDKTPLDFKPIGQAYNEAAAKFSFNGVPQPGVEGVQKQTHAVMEDWLRRAQTNPEFLTVEGLDALKRHLATVVPADVTNRAGRAFVSEVVDSVKSSIIKQRPEYAAAMKDYWQRAAQLDEIEKTLSLGDNAMRDTALRKLQSLARNNANTNYGQRSVLAQALANQGGADVMPAIAGQALNSWTPRGLQALGATGVGGYGLANPASLLALPAMSPRLVGEVANAAGNVSRSYPAELTIKALRRMTPAAYRIGARGEPTDEQ